MNRQAIRERRQQVTLKFQVGQLKINPVNIQFNIPIACCLKES